MMVPLKVASMVGSMAGYLVERLVGCLELRWVEKMVELMVAMKDLQLVEHLVATMVGLTVAKWVVQLVVD